MTGDRLGGNRADLHADRRQRLLRLLGAFSDLGGRDRLILVSRDIAPVRENADSIELMPRRIGLSDTDRSDTHRDPAPAAGEGRWAR